MSVGSVGSGFDHQPVVDIESWQDRFNTLMREYYRVFPLTHGLPEGLAQEEIDKAYEKLERFVDDHPEFKDQLPSTYNPLHPCRSDDPTNPCPDFD